LRHLRARAPQVTVLHASSRRTGTIAAAGQNGSLSRFGSHGHLLPAWQFRKYAPLSARTGPISARAPGGHSEHVAALGRTGTFTASGHQRLSPGIAAWPRLSECRYG